MDVARTQLGFDINPNLTQIFSIASGYTSNKNHLPKAIEFIEYGLEFYPNYVDLNLTLLDYVKRLGDDSKYQKYKSDFIQKTKDRSDLTKKEKTELINSIE